ncbi:MAG: LysE family transporter [Verrucomicrobiae bacterium]|nr:LysE family transporter [Verrucomicrobiae bacterium]
MFDNYPFFLSWLTGFISGILLSIPVGPINLTILNEGAQKGFKWAFFIGLGAVVAETIYCAVAFTGFASFFSRGYVKAAMELFSFTFMLYLGIKFILSRTVSDPTRLMPSQLRLEEKIEHRMEEKFHPHSAFAIGLVRVFGNPGVLIFWIILAANFVSREWVEPNLHSKITCVVGVVCGTLLWYSMLSWISAKGHGRMDEKSLLRMERFSGVILLVLALAHGMHITYQLYKAQMVKFHWYLRK